MKSMREHINEMSVNLEKQTQVSQLRAQEVAELTEDIKTITRENNYISGEFGKSSHANEYLHAQNKELQEKERQLE